MNVKISKLESAIDRDISSQKNRVVIKQISHDQVQSLRLTTLSNLSNKGLTLDLGDTSDANQSSKNISPFKIEGGGRHFEYNQAHLYLVKRQNSTQEFQKYKTNLCTSLKSISEEVSTPQNSQTKVSNQMDQRLQKNFTFPDKNILVHDIQPSNGSNNGYQEQLSTFERLETEMEGICDETTPYGFSIRQYLLPNQSIIPVQNLEKVQQIFSNKTLLQMDQQIKSIIREKLLQKIEKQSSGKEQEQKSFCDDVIAKDYQSQTNYQMKDYNIQRQHYIEEQAVSQFINGKQSKVIGFSPPNKMLIQKDSFSDDNLYNSSGSQQNENAIRLQKIRIRRTFGEEKPFTFGKKSIQNRDFLSGSSAQRVLSDDLNGSEIPIEFQSYRKDIAPQKDMATDDLHILQVITQNSQEREDFIQSDTSRLNFNEPNIDNSLYEQSGDREREQNSQSKIFKEVDPEYFSKQMSSERQQSYQGRKSVDYNTENMNQTSLTERDGGFQTEQSQPYVKHKLTQISQINFNRQNKKQNPEDCKQSPQMLMQGNSSKQEPRQMTKPPVKEHLVGKTQVMTASFGGTTKEKKVQGQQEFESIDSDSSDLEQQVKQQLEDNTPKIDFQGLNPKFRAAAMDQKKETELESEDYTDRFERDDIISNYSKVVGQLSGISPINKVIEQDNQSFISMLEKQEVTKGINKLGVMNIESLKNGKTYNIQSQFDQNRFQVRSSEELAQQNSQRSSICSIPYQSPIIKGNLIPQCEIDPKKKYITPTSSLQKASNKYTISPNIPKTLAKKVLIESQQSSFRQMQKTLSPTVIQPKFAQTAKAMNQENFKAIDHEDISPIPSQPFMKSSLGKESSDMQGPKPMKHSASLQLLLAKKPLPSTLSTAQHPAAAAIGLAQFTKPKAFSYASNGPKTSASSSKQQDQKPKSKFSHF